jgi:HEAT repeat protein
VIATAASFTSREARVRAAAVSRLGEGESYGAQEGLVEALEDPDTEVVLEAIDEIAFQGDASLVASLEPLVDHADPRIAEAAGEAIAFIEF